MKKLRVALAGLGRIADMRRQGYVACQRAELAAICDADAEALLRRAAQWRVEKTYASFDNLLDDPDVDREILKEITELFDVPAGAPNNAPIDGSIGTGIMAWFLKAALDVRLHPCMESNQAKAHWIQRVRGKQPPTPDGSETHDHHFEDRWPMNRLNGAPDWGPTNHLAEQARRPL